MTSRRRGVVFLDRDGVINVPPSKRYVISWEEFRFLPGVLPALKQLRRLRFSAFILSNQAGVGRGWMSRSELTHLTQNMLKEIRKAGGDIQAVYYCTHAPDAGCGCRKPKLGLFRRVRRRWPIDPSRSVVVGDNLTDIQMGQAVGCKTVLVLTGATNRKMLRGSPIRPDRVARDLPEAVSWILSVRAEPVEARTATLRQAQGDRKLQS